jgi:membrane protein YqaA with SNARE-associated domain
VFLFLIIFAETGVVVFRFCRRFRSCSSPAPWWPRQGSTSTSSCLILAAAAILGDTVNYSIGHYIGPRVFDKPDSRWFRQEHLRRTQAFYDRYGGFTIIVARFVPIIRTFAPFLAGVAGMSYRRFLSFNVIGGDRVDRVAVLRGLPVRQHSRGSGQPREDRSRDHRRLADPGGDHVHEGAARAEGFGALEVGGALDALRELGGLADVRRRRQRAQSRFRLGGNREAVDERHGGSRG